MQKKTEVLAVRNPAGILRLERLLCGGAVAPNLLSPQSREVLALAAADPSASRVPLCVDVMLALFDWLLARNWTRSLESDARLRNTVGNLLGRLACVLSKGDTVNTRGVEDSLVVRYLVAMAATGVDVTNRAQVMAATFQNDSFKLPRYWPAPAEKWRQNVTEADWFRFLTDWEGFWLNGGSPSAGRPRQKRERRKSLQEYFAEQGLLPPTQEQKRNAVRPLRETEMESDAPPADRQHQAAHAGLSAFAAQITIDSRPLAVGLKLLERVMRLQPEKQSPRRCACIAVIEIALFCGLAVHDALNVALGPTKLLVPGTFNAGRGCLTSHLASGYHHGILGRIPPQDVDLPLPSHTLGIFQRLVNDGYGQISQAFGTKPLDAFLEDVADLMSTGGIRDFLRRLDIGWLYAAHRLAKLNPGVIALLRGDVFGPYRSESNYLTITERSLWASAYKIHDEIAGLLGLPAPEGRESGRAEVRIGKLAASLATLADEANAILDLSEGINEIAACSSWIQQLHGRRPTGDHPHPAAYAVQCGATPVFFLGDKNMSGQRRIRIVPATSSAFEAALAARKYEADH